MTLLRQQRLHIAKANKDANKEDSSKLFFDGCPLKITIIAAQDLPKEFSKKVFATIHVKEEKAKTSHPWKLPFDCDFMCRDLMSLLKVQLYNSTKFGITEQFLVCSLPLPNFHHLYPLPSTIPSHISPLSPLYPICIFSHHL
jgi:hypothetical protein